MTWNRRSAMSSEVRFKFPLKPNTENPKIQHQKPFVLPPKASEKLTSIHIIITLTHSKRSLTLSPPFSNACIDLRHKTQQLQNLHSKRVQIPYTIFFRPPISTPSSQDYETLDGFNTSPLSV